MIQTLPVGTEPTQLELIGPPPTLTLAPPTEEMIPRTTQGQCVAMLAELLAEIVAPASEGGPNER